MDARDRFAGRDGVAVLEPFYRLTRCEGDRAICGLRLRYILALSCVLVLTLVGQWWLRAGIERMRADGSLINTAGRQRMLSQKVAKSCFALEEANHLGDPDLMRLSGAELSETLAKWRAAHYALWHGDEALGFPAASPEIAEAFSEIDVSFQATVEAAQAVLSNHTDAGRTPDRRAEHAEFTSVLAGERAYLPQMDRIVGMFETEASSKLAALKRAETMLLVVTLLVLLAEVLLVFEPAVRLIRKQLRQLGDAVQRAEQAAAAKSEFLARMSHEIRTPMTAILGYAELLDQPDQTTSDRYNASKVIQRQGASLLAIINDVLDLSKIEAGKLTISPEPCDPAAIVRDTVELMRFNAASKSIDLSWNADGPIPASFETDPARFRQILVNLVGNAVKFTPSGSVSITLSTDNGTLLARVVDTGIGITPQQQEQVFNPFSQADGSNTRQHGGTGLGLAISRHLAGLMGGAIELTSETGKGSTFILRLPLGELGKKTLTEATVSAASEARVTNPESVAEKVALEGLRILVAEDGLDNQRLIGYHLRNAGARVDIAENGSIAIEMIHSAARSTVNGYDMVFMDMQMPEMDGYAASRSLRADGCTIPIVALTAHAMAENRKRCLDAGCDDYMTKPIDRKRLIRLAAQWADHGRTRRAA